MNGVLMSIQPEFATAILDGRKTVELRRRAPRCEPGDILLIYETAPTAAIVGYAIVRAVDSGSTKSLWRSAGRAADVSKALFDEYFAGVEEAHGIRLGNPRRLLRPIALSTLREKERSFNPPQSWRYLAGLSSGVRSLFQQTLVVG